MLDLVSIKNAIKTPVTASYHKDPACMIRQLDRRISIIKMLTGKKMTARELSKETKTSERRIVYDLHYLADTGWVSSITVERKIGQGRDKFWFSNE